MKNIYVRSPVTSFLAIILIIMLGNIACTPGTKFTAPPALELAPLPITVDMDKIWQEFETNPSAALQFYRGKRLYFKNVVPEFVSSYYLNARAFNNIYLAMGNFEFRPRYATDIDGILPGFSVDVVGECLGVISGKLIITDCWVKVLGGDLGDIKPDVY